MFFKKQVSENVNPHQQPRHGRINTFWKCPKAPFRMTRVKYKMAIVARKETFGTLQDVKILTNNRVTDTVAGQNQYFLKTSEGLFSDDAGYIFCNRHV